MKHRASVAACNKALLENSILEIVHFQDVLFRTRIKINTMVKVAKHFRGVWPRVRFTFHITVSQTYIYAFPVVKHADARVAGAKHKGHIRTATVTT